MKNIYGYIRVSTKKQGDGVSLEVQKRDIEYFAKNKNLNIVEWFEEQKSASKGYRPKFNQMIEKLYNKEADGFVAHKIDRMMRNRHDWAIINELIDEGCEVLSADGTTLDDVNGRFMGDIQAAVATRYSSNLAQETKKGLYGRLAQGIFPFRAPLGYINHGKAKVKTPCPLIAPLIQQLFDLYVYKGYSTPMLVQEMRKRGLKNLSGNNVTLHGIITILKNSFYTGIIEVKGQKFTGNHEPIISLATYKKAQQILNGKANSKVLKHDFLYRKMITCSHCGYRLIGELQKGLVYYRCQTRDCPTTTINERLAKTQIYSLLESIKLTDSETIHIENALNDSREVWQEKKKNLLKELHMRKGALQTKQERITQLLIEGTIDKETYQSEKARIIYDLQEITEQETKLNENALHIHDDIAKCLELSKDPILLYETANVDEKREILKWVTSNLKLDGKTLLFTMLSPFYELANRSMVVLCEHNYSTPRNTESFLVRADQIQKIRENDLCEHNYSIPRKESSFLVRADQILPTTNHRPLNPKECRLLVDHILNSYQPS